MIADECECRDLDEKLTSLERAVGKLAVSMDRVEELFEAREAQIRELQSEAEGRAQKEVSK